MFLSASSLSHGTTLASAAVQNAPVVEAASIATDTIDTLPPLDVQPIPAKPLVSIEEYVKVYYAKTPILAKVAKCESQYRQFTTNGDVLRGKEVHQDVGVMQINETYHKAEAEKLGYDIYTLDGNLAFGQYLYDHQGTAPWSASAPCWNN